MKSGLVTLYISIGYCLNSKPFSCLLESYSLRGLVEQFLSCTESGLAHNGIDDADNLRKVCDVIVGGADPAEVGGGGHPGSVDEETKIKVILLVLALKLDFV